MSHGRRSSERNPRGERAVGGGSTGSARRAGTGTSPPERLRRMNPLAILRVAVRALLRNKMRSFLTTLGIIIGIAAVIAMVAIGEGAKNRVEEAFASMGTNLLIVMPGSTMTGGAHGG